VVKFGHSFILGWVGKSDNASFPHGIMCCVTVRSSMTKAYLNNVRAIQVSLALTSDSN